MNIQEKTMLFISTNNESCVKDFHDRLYENLKELSAKEEKFLLWEVAIIFLYLFTANEKFNSISLGPLSITDTTVIAKILPLVFLFILYMIHSVTLQKQEVLKAFETITKNRFSNNINNEKTASFLIRICNPYDFANLTVHLIRDNSSIKEFIVGLILIFPVIIIGVFPFIIAISMVVDLYNYSVDMIGKISFAIALWVCILIAYHYFIVFRASLRNNRSN